MLLIKQGPSGLRSATPKWDSMWQTLRRAERYHQHTPAIPPQVIREGWRWGLGQEGPTLGKETPGKCTAGGLHLHSSCRSPFLLSNAPLLQRMLKHHAHQPRGLHCHWSPRSTGRLVASWVFLTIADALHALTLMGWLRYHSGGGGT